MSEDIQAQVEVIYQVQALAKKLGMIYQFSLKCEVAGYYNLSFEQVNLPYEEWAALRDKYLEEKYGRAKTTVS